MKKELWYGPLMIVAIWYCVFLMKIVNPLFLPPPHTVIAKLVVLLATPDVWMDICSTLWRVVISFVIASLVGIPIGLFMGYYKSVYRSFEIPVDFFRSLPALALFPLFMFFFGIGDTAKIVTAVFSCSLIIVVNAIYGVQNVTKTRQVIARLLRASRLEVFHKVVLMDALPQIFAGMRTGLSLAVVVVVVTEMFVGTTWGVGHRIFDSQLTYKVSEMYASIIIAGLIGYFLNKGFVAIEHRVVHWSGK